MVQKNVAIHYISYLIFTLVDYQDCFNLTCFVLDIRLHQQDYVQGIQVDL